MKLRWESTSARESRLCGWHYWFAWRPVRVGPNDVRWLEVVQRRGSLRWGGRDFGDFLVWEYLPREDEAT